MMKVQLNLATTCTKPQRFSTRSKRTHKRLRKSNLLFLLFCLPIILLAQENVIDLNQREGETIVLDYANNDFVIKYVGIQFDAPERIQYQYKMEGLHDDWQHVGTERTARFNNLSAGEYTFMVKASNADGVWNETPATIQFKILQPWYWTWWAKLLYVSAIGWLAFFMYRFDYYRRLAKAESKRLEKLIIAQQKRQNDTQAAPDSDTSPTTSPSSKNIFLDKIKAHVERNLDNDNYSVEDLAKDMNMSRQQLYRKTKAFTGKSVASYVRLIRLHFGKQLLRSTDLTVAEVAYQVGFSEPSYFSRSFSEEFGYAPSEQRG